MGREVELHSERPRSPSLEQRFFTFARTIEGTEVIDDLALTPEQASAEKADLLLDDRRIVCEVKSLKTDTKNKVDRVLAAYQNTPEWPMFYGEWEVSKIIAHLPNSQEIAKRLVREVSSSVDELVRKANRQIRSTKQHFKLEAAAGVLVVLNDLVEVLAPDIVLHRLHELLKKRNADGQLQFFHITAVWVLHETHVVKVQPDGLAVPAAILPNGSVQDPVGALDFLKGLQPRWAEFNGMPSVPISEETFRQLPVYPVSKVFAPPKEDSSRADLHRMAYSRRPYLRGLTEEKLVDLGRETMREWARLFFVGSTGTDDERARCILRFTHFMEEINHRGIDMRKLKPVIREEDLPKLPGGPGASESAGRGSRPFEMAVVAGRFYVDPRLGFSYYCEDVSDGVVRWVLVESYQHGQLFQACFTQQIEDTDVYVAILDDEEIERLASMYRGFREQSQRLGDGTEAQQRGGGE